MYLLVAQGLLVTLDVSAIYMRPLLSCITRSFVSGGVPPGLLFPWFLSCVCIQKLNKNNGNEVLEISYKIMSASARCQVPN